MNKITFGKFEADQDGAGSWNIYENGVEVGAIEKEVHDVSTGMHRDWRTSSYSVTFWEGCAHYSHDKAFHVEDFKDARAAHKAAKDHVRAVFKGDK